MDKKINYNYSSNNGVLVINEYNLNLNLCLIKQKPKLEVKQQRSMPVKSIVMYDNFNMRAFGAMNPDLCKSVYTRELWRTSCIEGADLYSIALQCIRPCNIISFVNQNSTSH